MQKLQSLLAFAFDLFQAICLSLYVFTRHDSLVLTLNFQREGVSNLRCSVNPTGPSVTGSTSKWIADVSDILLHRHGILILGNFPRDGQDNRRIALTDDGIAGNCCPTNPRPGSSSMDLPASFQFNPHHIMSLRIEFSSGVGFLVF
jgi:hypothetical protein